MWSYIDRENKQPRTYEFARFKGYFGWTIQGEWSAMVWAFLRRDNGDVLRRALDFEVAKRRGRGRPNMTWKKYRSNWTEKGKCH